MIQGVGGRDRRWIILAAAFVLSAIFTALGVWQIERLAWKVDLIARVSQRIHAAPIAPPGRDQWTSVSAKRDAYTRVRVSGVFEDGDETLVQALTEQGPGFWLMTPLRTTDGEIILVNRGFLTPEAAAARRPAGQLAGPTTVTGLLRVSEPHGGFLRANQAAAGRWYSRDVAAIARAHGLSNPAPYFIDADATPNVGGWPRGGLTVVRFPNSHLSYAFTWFTLAAMSAGWGVWAVLEGRHPPRRAFSAECEADPALEA